MEKRLIGIGLIIGIVMGFVVGSVFWHFMVDMPIINEWNDRATLLETDLKSAVKSKEALETEITRLREEISSLQAEVSSLQAEVRNLERQTDQSEQGVGSSEPTLLDVDFSFENKWGTYKATAYYDEKFANAPVVIFAHGLGANKDCYKWMIQPLVKSGFVVVMFTVPQGIFDQLLGGEGGMGSLFGGGGMGNLLSLLGRFGGGFSFFSGIGGGSLPFGGGMGNFFEEILKNIPFEQWPDGIISCIDALESMPELNGIINKERIFVIGHSAGGLGALVAANATNDPLRRIKGVVALAPPVVEDAQEWSGPPPTSLDVPVQLQVGTLDSLYDAVKAYYNKLETNGCEVQLVEIEGGDHVQFMDPSIVSLMRIISIFMEIPFIGESAAEISVGEQHRQSSEAFLNFLSSS